MKKISNWRAKRAGGRMTVYGKDEAGKDIKATNVDTIEGPGEPRGAIIATDKDGVQFNLVP